jgi:hypothetical protein
MKWMRWLSLLLLLCGCSGFSLWDSGPTYEEKQQFLAELDQQNLTPRERCKQIYGFDADWAREFSECRALVDSLEALDKAMAEDKLKIVPATQK